MKRICVVKKCPASNNPIGQLTNAAATLADDTPWQAYRFGYQYDSTGNPVEQDKNGLVFSNSFNHLNQNVATVPGGSLAVMGRVNYAGGNVVVNSVQAQLSPDLIFAATGIPFTLGTNVINTVFTDPFGRSTNRQTSVVVTQKAYQYDANGNMTNDGRITYFWNDENRLIAVRSAKTGAMIQENRYDGLGRRREKIEHGADGITTNRYLYQNWLVLAVTDGTGNVLETYTHGADLSGQVGGGAGGIGGILALMQANATAFYHYDFNGNVVQVSGSNQTQLAKYTYGPFGEVLLKEGEFNSRYQFSTKELDMSTGMNYYGYRCYSPGFGRWASRDPITMVENIALNLIIIGPILNYKYDSINYSKCTTVDQKKYELVRYYYSQYLDENDTPRISGGISADMIMKYIIEAVANNTVFRLESHVMGDLSNYNLNTYSYVDNTPVLGYDYLGLQRPGTGSGGCTLSYNGCLDTGCSASRYGRNKCVYDDGRSIGDIVCRPKGCYCNPVN